MRTYSKCTTTRLGTGVLAKGKGCNGQQNSYGHMPGELLECDKDAVLEARKPN